MRCWITSVWIAGIGSVGFTAPTVAAETVFIRQEIASDLKVGYGLAIADIDGDGRPDLVVVESRWVAWFRNPDWTRFVMARELTPQDHVCVAARDIDGDGRAEVAVGAGWNPADTVTSGALFVLRAGEDRTQPWTPVRLEHEPTVHRMHWVRTGRDRFELMVLPLHGRGNRGGEGSGVRLMSYRPPAAAGGAWAQQLVHEGLHMTHNFDLLDETRRDAGPESMVLASREGIYRLELRDGAWVREALVEAPAAAGFRGAGEVRMGRGPGGGRMLATIEPMHGNEVVAYHQAAGEQDAPWVRRVLDNTLLEGHALGCGDLLRLGYDQVVAGWRGRGPGTEVGIKLYVPPASTSGDWRERWVDRNTVACEDLVLGDLDGDGRIDIAATGRATGNLVVYWNRAPSGSDDP
jgi:hypothetical protein